MTSGQEVEQALHVARRLIEAGIPVFAAEPDGKGGHLLPAKWQLTVPSMTWIEKWRPGWGLGAVGGHAGDFLDEDPRHGGDESVAELLALSQMPRAYGVAETPSGGRHYLIAPLHEGRMSSVMPGLDYQGGRPDGTGRAFVWIAPTVRASKVTGEMVAYRWTQEPDLEWLAEGGDESGVMVAARVHAARARKTSEERAADTRPAGLRRFTLDEARTYCSITLDRLMAAQIGEIEERANDAAVTLSHFVPDIFSEDYAFAALSAALAVTAYDAATWHADKFRDVIAGRNGRAPGDWRAEPVAASVDEAVAAASVDEVDALIAEMLSPAEISTRPAPRPLIKGLLTLDSESWLIGAPGSKKSFVALDMAAHVVRGEPWQGRKVTAGEVVMIVAEGAGGMSLRIRAWEQKYGEIGAGMRILPRPVQAADLSKWAVLVKACERLKPSLIVIDTQARVTVGLEENSATDMGVYVAAAGALREATGACVLTVHHTGRQGGDARGSSAIDGAQTTELKVKSTGRLTGELVTEKQKDLEQADPVPLAFKVVGVGMDEDGAELTSLIVAGEWEAARVAAVEDHSYVISEPDERWERYTAPSATGQRRILQLLAELAQAIELPEPRIRSLYTKQWRAGKKMDERDWTRQWDGVRKLVFPAGSPDAGEPLVVCESGQRYRLHPSLNLDA